MKLALIRKMTWKQTESDCVVDYTDKSPMDKKEQKQFTKEQIAVYRNNCLEISQSELDLVILTAIMCSRPPSGENCHSARATTIYLHQGVHNYLHEDILVSSLSFPFSLEQSPDIRTSMESLLTPILNPLYHLQKCESALYVDFLGITKDPVLLSNWFGTK